MNLTHLLEHTDGYLRSQFRDSRTPWNSPSRTAPFITISREAGSGGSSLARLLVRKLNGQSPDDVVWRVYEGDLPAQMLRLHHLPPTVARFLPEDRVPELAATIGELVGLHPNLWQLMQKTNETIRQYAGRGHVVLVGRGGNFATMDLPNGLHVRLIAPEEFRARYLAEQYDLSMEQAKRLNAKCEAARSRYVKAAFGADVADPAAYDIVINTARVSLDAAAEMIRARVATLAKPNP